MKEVEPKHAVKVRGYDLLWSVRSWPKWCWCNEKYNGLSILVELTGTTRRHLVIDYPFDSETHPHRQLRVRPRIQTDEVVKHIETGMDLGWIPDSKGKPFLLQLEEGDSPFAGIKVDKRTRQG